MLHGFCAPQIKGSLSEASLLDIALFWLFIGVLLSTRFGEGRI